MKLTNYKVICLMVLMILSTGTAKAQDVIITRPKPKTQTTTAKLKPKPRATTGTLSITSSPSGVAIKVDGKYIGETPLTMNKQKPKTYFVTFNAEGYESQTYSVTLTAGKTTTCNATLTKKQPLQQVAQQPPSSQNSRFLTAPVQTFTANGVSFNMIFVEGNGSPYYIGETEVTQALWQAVMGNNPSHFKGSSRPVERVSWNDCQEFIQKLNSITGKSFRLPRESEWMFAAKGGINSHGYMYSGSNKVGDVAWYDKNAYYCGSSSTNSNRPDYGTHPVKTKSPNELGIYDMSGNVFEWCEELRDDSDSRRLYHGGSWINNASSCRVSYRNWDGATYRNGDLGLRLAL